LFSLFHDFLPHPDYSQVSLNTRRRRDRVWCARRR
jgi:hypothetical protein